MVLVGLDFLRCALAAAQGRLVGEKSNSWTYLLMAGDVLFFIAAAILEHDILNNFSILLLLPLFQYLLRYGQTVKPACIY